MVCFYIGCYEIHKSWQNGDGNEAASPLLWHGRRRAACDRPAAAYYRIDIRDCCSYELRPFQPNLILFIEVHLHMARGWLYIQMRQDAVNFRYLAWWFRLADGWLNWPPLRSCRASGPVVQQCKAKTSNMTCVFKCTPPLQFHNLYYKRVDPYLWTELAPVLKGSGSRRRRPRKGRPTSADRVCVFVARVDRRICLLFVKKGFVVGARSMKVGLTTGHWNDTFFWREHSIVSVSCTDRRDTIQCSLPGARKDGRLEGGSKGRVGRDGARGGSGEAMMWRRVGAGVEEDRAGWGREWVRKERRHGRSEGKRGERKRAEERGSNRARERSNGGAWEERRSGGKETSREVLWGGHCPVWYTAHKTTHNAALAIATLVLQNGYIKSVLWCVVMYCLTGGCHDFMWWQLWTGCIWNGLGV